MSYLVLFPYVRGVRRADKVRRGDEASKALAGAQRAAAVDVCHRHVHKTPRSVEVYETLPGRSELGYSQRHDGELVEGDDFRGDDCALREAVLGALQWQQADLRPGHKGRDAEVWHVDIHAAVVGTGHRAG
jgi:hypothetical protein